MTKNTITSYNVQTDGSFMTVMPQLNGVLEQSQTEPTYVGCLTGYDNQTYTDILTNYPSYGNSPPNSDGTTLPYGVYLTTDSLYTYSSISIFNINMLYSCFHF